MSWVSQISGQDAADDARRAQEAAAAAAAAAQAQAAAEEEERKKQKQFQEYNASVQAAQNKLSSNRNITQEQLSNYEEIQKTKDAQALIPTAVSKRPFDIKESQMAAMSNAGAASSAGGKAGLKSSAAQAVSQPANNDGSEKNKFLMPDIKNISFGGI
jgi:hypothetical protein